MNTQTATLPHESSISETAGALGISKATAKRHWDYPRAWLYEEIRAQQAGEAAG